MTKKTISTSKAGRILSVEKPARVNHGRLVEAISGKPLRVAPKSTSIIGRNVVTHRDALKRLADR